MGETWRDIPGYPGYQASSLGRVRSIDRCLLRSDGRQRAYYGKELKANKTKDGYLRVFPRGAVCVHVLVAKAFLPNPDKLEQVNHIDGDKENNRVDNLEWVSRAQNIQHAKYTLRRNIGFPCKRILCVETGKEYKSIREAWRDTGIHWTCIAKVINKTEGRTRAGGFHWVEKRFF